MQRDPVDPSAQGGLAVKPSDSPEDLDEDFLGEISRVRSIVHGARQERVDRLMIVRDQPGKGLF